MMGIVGFQTKKALKAAKGETPQFIETSMFGNEFHGDGKYVVVGPTPKKRIWFAQVTVADGVIAKVT